MEIDNKNTDRLFEKFGRSYNGGEIIFDEKDEAKEVYIIIEGRVRVIKRVRHIEQDMVILKTGDIFGETALIKDQKRTASLVALGKCRVLAFQVTDFQTLLHEQSEIALKLISQLIGRLKVSEERIENMMLRDSLSKIVNTLLKLSSATSPNKNDAKLVITPIELSSRIGLDVDSVKQGILHLKEHNYLNIIGEKLEIYDVEALLKLYHLIGMKEDLKKRSYKE